MNPYEELIHTMRSQGAHENPPAIQIGRMEEGGVVNLGGLKLNKKDYLMGSSLLLEGSKQYWCFGSGNREGPLELDERTCIHVGDMVAMVFLSEKNRYLLLMKVVVPA